MENKKNFTDEELYTIAIDAFKQTHKPSYLLLHTALRQALKRLPEDCAIYLLMNEMNVLHNTKRN